MMVLLSGWLTLHPDGRMLTRGPTAVQGSARQGEVC